MYGNFKPKKTKDDKKERLANVRKMKNLYLHSSQGKYKFNWENVLIGTNWVV